MLQYRFDSLPLLPTACDSHFEVFSTSLPQLHLVAEAAAARDGLFDVFQDVRKATGGRCKLAGLPSELGGASGSLLARSHTDVSPRVRDILAAPDNSLSPRNLSEHFGAAAAQDFYDELVSSATTRGRLQQRLHPYSGSSHHLGGESRGRPPTRDATRYAPSNPDAAAPFSDDAALPDDAAPDTDARSAAHHRQFAASASRPFSSDAPLRAAAEASRPGPPSPIHRALAPEDGRGSRPARNHSGSLPPVHRTHAPASFTSPTSVHAFPDSDSDPRAADARYRKLSTARHFSALALAIGGKFPNTFRAVFGAEPSSLDDLTFLPVESLRAACDTIAAQMYGFLLVRNSVIRAAGNHGYLGGKAAETFASEMALDLRLAGEIRSGRFRTELTRAEKVLRLLPIGQLALVAAGIYVRSPDEAVSAALLKAVAGVSLTDPRLPGTLRITGIQHLQLAFGKARERSALVDWTKLTKEIARPIIAASNISYSDSADSGWDDDCDSHLDGSDRGIKLDFANFRSSVKRLIGRSRYSSEDEPVSYTCAQFKMIVDRLTLFADAIAADLDDSQPPDFDQGGSHVHAVHRHARTNAVRAAEQQLQAD